MRGFDIVINEEKLGNKKIFIARCLNINVSSQGRSYEEAMKNIEEAIELNLKTYPELKKQTSERKIIDI